MKRITRNHLPVSPFLFLSGGLFCALVLLLSNTGSRDLKSGTGRKENRHAHSTRPAPGRHDEPPAPSGKPSSSAATQERWPQHATHTSSLLPAHITAPAGTDESTVPPSITKSSRLRVHTAASAPPHARDHVDPGNEPTPVDNDFSIIDGGPDHGKTIPVAKPQPPKLPASFFLPELQAEPGTRDEEIIYQARQDFADEMAASPDMDPESPGYAEQWKRAVESHDEYLRRSLGWEKFNQLSAIASQRGHSQSASPP